MDETVLQYGLSSVILMSFPVSRTVLDEVLFINETFSLPLVLLHDKTALVISFTIACTVLRIQSISTISFSVLSSVLAR